jgi:hypothetical protein
MLHTLGLGENPPSSTEITRRVHAACRSRASHEQSGGGLQVGDVGGTQRTTRSSSDVPAAASASGDQSWPRIHIEDPYVRDGARRILDAAATLLEDRQCEDVTSDLVDVRGQPLATRLAELGMKASDYLRVILFYDGAGQGACKRDGILAYTAPGSRVIISVAARSFELRSVNRKKPVPSSFTKCCTRWVSARIRQRPKKSHTE